MHRRDALLGSELSRGCRSKLRSASVLEIVASPC
jgi:hypothetical protein